ncbi:hypothetical protein V6N11_073367 [Hibiscus sabdariffa]|uniref:Uncharacterized protein n=1 Tax=Hibiscus sabdariffa TaxID=183260 RepID=A0ABR2P4E7_9ROSI
MNPETFVAGVNILPRAYEDQSGRPSDEIPMIEMQSPLERATSPTPLEGQSISKKEGLVPMGRSPQHKVSGVVDSSKVTYASKLISNDIHARDGKGATEFLEQEVVILAEDIIVNNAGPENCPKLNVETVDKHNKQESIVAQGEGICSESNLYGPWMLAGSRRRKPLSTMKFVTVVNKQQPANRGSRYTVLSRDLTDNQGRESRSEKALTDSYTAIQIVEHDAKCSDVAGKGKKSTSGSKFGGVELTRKGLRVRKIGDGRKSKLGVIEWVKSANARINALGQHNDESSILLSDDEEFEDDEYTMHMADAFDGAGSLPFRRHFKNFIRENRPKIVVLVEPRIHGYVVDNVVARLGFPNSYCVETNGFRGGIWLLWDNSVRIEIMHVSNQFVNAMVSGPSVSKEFQLTAVYASPSYALCKHIWSKIGQIKPSLDVPWTLEDLRLLEHVVICTKDWIIVWLMINGYSVMEMLLCGIWIGLVLIIGLCFCAYLMMRTEE